MHRSSSRLDNPSQHPIGTNIRGRTVGVRILTKTAFAIFLITACVALIVLSVPQVRRLRGLEEELSRGNALETHVRNQKEQKRRELNSLREDPAYLELIARDRLDLYREGEKIYRIEQK